MEFNFVEIAKELLKQGILGVCLVWFMWRAENLLKALTKSIDRSNKLILMLFYKEHSDDEETAAALRRVMEEW